MSILSFLKFPSFTTCRFPLTTKTTHSLHRTRLLFPFQTLKFSSTPKPSKSQQTPTFSSLNEQCEQDLINFREAEAQSFASGQSLLKSSANKNLESSTNFLDERGHNTMTSMSSILERYNKEYSLDTSNLKMMRSSAQAIPGFKHLYVIQLEHPESGHRVNVIGLRQQSILDQDEVGQELRQIIENVKPAQLIVQFCKDRYEAHMSFRVDNLIAMSCASVWKPQHLGNTIRMALKLINYVCMDYQLRVNPYLLAVFFGNECESVENILLGDVPMSVHTAKNDGTLLTNYKDAFRLMSHTTRKERRDHGMYPGVKELLLGVNSVPGVFEYLHANKKAVLAKERSLHQFAIDMQQRVGCGEKALQDTAKSMAYYAYKHAPMLQGESHTTMVICNVFTMLSLPLYFGRVTEEENRELRKGMAIKKQTAPLIRKWVLNYWSGLCWMYCSLYTVCHTGIYNIDYTHLAYFGIALPCMYPFMYAAFCLRARARTRKMQKIIIEDINFQRKTYSSKIQTVS